MRSTSSWSGTAKFNTCDEVRSRGRKQRWTFGSFRAGLADPGSGLVVHKQRVWSAAKLVGTISRDAQRPSHNVSMSWLFYGRQGPVQLLCRLP